MRFRHYCSVAMLIAVGSLLLSISAGAQAPWSPAIPARIEQTKSPGTPRSNEDLTNYLRDRGYLGDGKAGLGPRPGKIELHMPTNPQITDEQIKKQPKPPTPQPLPELRELVKTLPRFCSRDCEFFRGSVSINAGADCQACTYRARVSSCQKNEFSKVQLMAMEKATSEPRHQTCQAAAALMHSAQLDGELLKPYVVTDERADRWLTIRDIIREAATIVRLKALSIHPQVKPKDIADAAAVLRDYLENCFDPIGSAPQQQALERLVVFLKESEDYGFLPHCHGVRVGGHVFTARHCLRTPDKTRLQSVVVDSSPYSLVKGDAIEEPSKLSLHAYAWKDGGFEKIDLAIADNPSPRAYSGDNRVIADGKEFAESDWIALSPTSTPTTIALRVLPQPTTENVGDIGLDALDETLLVMGINANAVSKQLIDANFEKKFSAQELLALIRIDRTPTCRILALESGLIRHGCQTEGGLSGTPIYLHHTLQQSTRIGVLALQHKSNPEPIAACAPEIVAAAPNLGVRLAP